MLLYPLSIHDTLQRLVVSPKDSLPQLLSRFFHQQAHQGPLKSGEPGNDQQNEKIVEQPPGVKELWSKEDHQGQRNPMTEAVAAGEKIAEKSAALFYPLTKWRKNLRFSNRKRETSGNER